MVYPDSKSSRRFLSLSSTNWRTETGRLCFVRNWTGLSSLTNLIQKAVRKAWQHPVQEGNVILSLGNHFFTRLFIIIIAHNCPLYLCNWCYDITTEKNIYTRRVFFRAGATNWTLLKWRPWLLSWRLSLFPYVTVSQLESIPWMARSRLGCFLFISSLYHIIKIRYCEKLKNSQS